MSSNWYGSSVDSSGCNDNNDSNVRNACNGCNSLRLSMVKWYNDIETKTQALVYELRRIEKREQYAKD